jgi:hypothetical protein
MEVGSHIFFAQSQRRLSFPTPSVFQRRNWAVKEEKPQKDAKLKI